MKSRGKGTQGSRQSSVRSETRSSKRGVANWATHRPTRSSGRLTVSALRSMDIFLDGLRGLNDGN